MMNSNIKLPSELDIMAIPPLATLAILDVALAMAGAAIECEHINLEELHLYYAEGGQPPASMILANDIAAQSNALRKTISKYILAITYHHEHTAGPTILPF